MTRVKPMRQVRGVTGPGLFASRLTETRGAPLMRWQVEVASKSSATDSLGAVLLEKFRALGILDVKSVRTARLYDLEGPPDRPSAERLGSELLSDPVTETFTVSDWETFDGTSAGSVAVFRKQGVMDPVEAGILRGAKRLGIALDCAATATLYHLGDLPPARLEQIALAALANPAIETVQVGHCRFPKRKSAGLRGPLRVSVDLLGKDDAALAELSRRGGLSLSIAEMRAIQEHFAAQKRPPTEIELETLAQTWSEHCKHKTFAGRIRYSGEAIPGEKPGVQIENLFRQTIKAATEELARPFCLSVFHDNAGVIDFEKEWALCFKVETHNHPSAIEPYGGAGTGIGGVIRDILGTGQGARPVANTNVFCVGPPDLPKSDVPKGAHHPLRILRGVVEGVRDYGNQMGIPTVNGAVHFDERYTGNPLVYCGTVGLLPKSRIAKEVHRGDLIVALGGRTGRDGIHGATFSSVELHETSEKVDSGAVQIGNAITEKKVLDVVLAARDRNLFRAITDCGAGGFSSAVGEMGAELGAIVYLDRAPLKYEGLSPTEIWISEAQERMVMAVPPECVEFLLALAAAEDVEAFVLGEFSGDGRLTLYHGETLVGALEMEFLHEGLPRVVREASWVRPIPSEIAKPSLRPEDATKHLLSLLALPVIASKEWIIRQYDHEVQGGSVIKPLMGAKGQAPCDAAVVAPLLGSTVGFAVGCGMNTSLGDIDPYEMALAVIDEALRNVVAVGGDPEHCAILDNFSWGNTNYPDRLGGLVRAAYGCRDAALALGTPFISGKDSLNNEYKVGSRTIVIPPSLLISALARVPDIRRAVSMDLKRPGRKLFAIGWTSGEMGGSQWMRHLGRRGDDVPPFHGALARKIFNGVHQAIARGLVASCHDASEGGLLVALSEMVFAGEIGAQVDFNKIPMKTSEVPLEAKLFGESLTRFIVEVDPSHEENFLRMMDGLPCKDFGVTTAEPYLIASVGEKSPPLLKLSAAALFSPWHDGLLRHLLGRGTGVSDG